MKKKISLLVSVIFLSVGFTIIQPVFAQEDVGSGGIGGRPAYPREDNDRSESIFIHEIEPGSTVSDGIRVVNNTEEEKTIQVYSTDSIVSSGGAFACAQLVEEKTDVGNWIVLEKDEVTVLPSSSEIVDFTISVPENTDVGEHGGCVVVQEKKPQTESEQGIGLSFRTALRVAVLVPGEIQKELALVDFKAVVTADEEQGSVVVLTPYIENRGNVSVDTEINTTLSYMIGGQTSEAGGRYPVLRGQIGEWNFKHERPFWGGFIKAELFATYDGSDATFIGEETQDLRTITHEGIWLFVWPHPLAAAIEVLVLFILLYIIIATYRRLRHKKAVSKSWHSHTVKPGEDIKSIAKRTDISWKKLASANKIKAPYTLETNQTIKVPKKLSTKKSTAKPKRIIDVTKK